MIDERRLARIAALDDDLALRKRVGEVGPEAGEPLLFVDRERMGLPGRLAARSGGSANVGDEAAACRDAEPLALEDHAEARMVEEILADRQVGGDIDSERLQPFGRTDARALEQRGRVVDAGADDDLIGMGGRRLAVAADIGDAFGLRPGQQHAVGHRAGADREVGTLSCGTDIGDERSEPHFLVAVVRHDADDAGMRIEAVQVRRFAHARARRSFRTSRG